jgi:hypothetical protein
MSNLQMPRWRRMGFLVAVHIAAFAHTATAGTIVVVGDPGDGEVDVNGLPGSFALTQVRVGTGGNNVRGIADVFFFALPNVPSPTSIVGAQLNLQYLGISQFSVLVTPEFNADLFGLGARLTPTVLSSDYYDGNASLSTDTLLLKGLITPSTVPGSLHVSGSSLLNFLTSLYKPDGTPTAAYVVIRANADVHLPAFSNPYRGYELASADNGDASFRPELDLTVNAIPEPASFAILGGLAILIGGYCGRQRLPLSNQGSPR